VYCEITSWARNERLSTQVTPIGDLKCGGVELFRGFEIAYINNQFAVDFFNSKRSVWWVVIYIFNKKSRAFARLF